MSKTKETQEEFMVYPWDHKIYDRMMPRIIEAFSRSLKTDVFMRDKSGLPDHWILCEDLDGDLYFVKIVAVKDSFDNADEITREDFETVSLNYLKEHFNDHDGRASGHQVTASVLSNDKAFIKIKLYVER